MWRDSIFGELVFLASGRRLCVPRVLREDYVVPEKYFAASSPESFSIENISIEKGQSYTASAPYQVLVDWDSPDDVDNPQNWSLKRKVIICILIALLTTSQYMGSGIFTPAENLMLEHFNTTQTKLLLGLTMFVWGYGISALWFGPMSENPLFGGRNYIYFACQFIFVALQIPTALANHVATFVVLRFISGMMASPVLSTGAGTFSDIVKFPYIVWALMGWSLGAVSGPYIGPLIGGALVETGNWRWVFWYLLIQGGVVMILMFFFLPETSEQALLMRKAAHLRRRLGNPGIVAPGDLIRRSQTMREVLAHCFWRPLEIMVREPVVSLINLHVSLVYSLTYLFFDSYNVGFGHTYHFSPVLLGTTYLGLLVGVFVAMALYIPFVQRHLVAVMQERPQEFDPERYFGNWAIFGALGVPTGILVYAWTTSTHIYWIVSLVGAAIYAGSTWLMFQSENGYLSRLYPPQVTASAFASNTVCRCMMAGAFPLFGYQLFTLGPDDYPVGWGDTILGLCALAMVLIPLYLRVYGRALRTKAHEKYGGARLAKG